MERPHESRPGGEGSRQTFREFPPMTSAILAAGTGKTSRNFPKGWGNPVRVVAIRERAFFSNLLGIGADSN